MYNQMDTPFLEALDSFPDSLLEEKLTKSMKTLKIPSEVNNQYESLDMHCEEEEREKSSKGFLLLDEHEDIKVLTATTFGKKLDCPMDSKVKVVSIFGNTGDGKSHTMNHTFFDGENVFETSPAQQSCTVGVWTAFQPRDKVICIDTEGLLGITANERRRERMLLKVLAISDIIIYRTRSERLQSDLFKFLGNASRVFVKFFYASLQSLGQPQSLGPAVIIFHETCNTKILESSVDKSTEDVLRERFSEVQMDTEAFSSLRYIGIQTKNGDTNYGKLKEALQLELDNTTVRSPRTPEVIFKALETLNKKFSGELSSKPINPFPEQYFTCGITCESCDRQCERAMGHAQYKEEHFNKCLCTYQHQFENRVYLCNSCHLEGRQTMVKITTLPANESSWFGLAKYAWSGSVIECPICGEIYRSRQYWYGNELPEQTAVRIQVVHVWKDSKFMSRSASHSAQLVLDSVTYITGAVSSVSAQPTKKIKYWVADQMAPSYWKPNCDIVICHDCKINFEQAGLKIHHCRSCGEGFCNACSIHQMPVRQRNWYDPVRVCNQCRIELLRSNDISPKDERILREMPSSPGNPDDETNISVRKYGEVVMNTLSNLSTVLEYPKDLIKDSARPSYWIPDSEAPNCYLCNLPFGTAEELNPVLANTSPSRTNPERSEKLRDRSRHHCRACGNAVCHACSTSKRPVPEKGWTSDVRVCDSCIVDI